MDNNNVVLVCVFMGHMCVLQQPGICYYMTIVIEEFKTNKMALI